MLRNEVCLSPCAGAGEDTLLNERNACAGQSPGLNAALAHSGDNCALEWHDMHLIGGQISRLAIKASGICVILIQFGPSDSMEAL